MPWRKILAARLTNPLCEALMRLSRDEADCLREIRIRRGRPIQWIFIGKAAQSGTPVDSHEIEALLGALCAHSRYAYESQMAKGYIPLPGGHRAGVCGRVCYENGQIVRMSNVTSICIRIARDIQEASLPIRGFLYAGDRPARVLILGPPGAGKTTVLRDAAKYLCSECGLHVAAADEREELFAQDDQPDIDVLRGAKKDDGVTMLVRTMSPQVIVCDELGKEADTIALLDAVSSGVGVLASAHADCFADMMRRPALKALFASRAFDWYVLLKLVGQIAGVMDADGRELAKREWETGMRL